MTLFSNTRLYWVSIIILLINTYTAWGQPKAKETWNEKYAILHDEYMQNKISSSDYLFIIDSLTERLTVSGLSYSNEEIVNLLETFKKIAWAKEHQQQRYRANYYRFLMNNALGSGRSGEVLFYAKKNEQEAKLQQRESLLIPYVKLLVWAKSGNYKQVVSLYNEQRNYINSLITKEINNNNIAAYMQAMQFYFYVIVPLLKENNSLADEVKDNTILLETRIRNNYKKITNTKIDLAIPALLSLFCNIEYYAHHNDIVTEKKLLDSVIHIYNNANEKLGAFSKPYENIVNSLALNYYLKIKDNLNAEKYLQSLQNGVQIFDDEKSNLLKYQSQLSFNKDSLKEAYMLLDSALYFKITELSTAYQEVTNLLYAHTESEYNKRELHQKEAKRKKQNIWIVSIAIFAVIITIIAFLRIKKEKRKSQSQIKSMKKMSDIAINETRKVTAIEERKKLGQDLHDDLSASLVSILHTIVFIKQNKSKNIDIDNDIDVLNHKVNQLYTSVRTKSHQIFEHINTDSNISFEKSVAKIIDTILSSKFYTKTIEMDTAIVSALDLKQRIELLKILQESAANILKHSKATDISVFLFKSENNKEIIFQISDNGIGFNNLIKKKGVGLYSINERAKSINAQIEILNDYGTTIIVRLLNQASLI